MQNWKLTQDLGTLAVGGVNADNVESALAGTVIRDSGFASTAHPKLKFNFTIEIEYRGYESDGNGPPNVASGTNDMARFAIPVKTVTRPNPSVNLVDVNFYNYRTKVATRTDMGTFTVTFYDDSTEVAHGIVQQAMMDISPAANLTATDKQLMDDPYSVPFGGLSSVGPQEFRNGPIRFIKVHHHYVYMGNAMVGTYTYVNPRVQTVDFGDLDMSASEVTSASITFAYDGYSYEVADAPTASVGDLVVVR